MTDEHVLAQEPRLTGRTPELALLRSCLDEVEGGSGRALLLTGEQGIGKTRLAHELLADARQRGWQVLEGRGLTLHATLPYGPVVEAFGRMLRSVGDQRRAQLTADLPMLGHILDVGSAETLPRGLDPTADKLRLFESVARLLDRLSRNSPLVLFLDDLHWADPATLELLQHLCRDIASLPILVAVTFRPDEVDPAPGLRSVLATLSRTVPTHRIELARLDRAEVGELAEACAGAPVPPELTDWLVSRSVGTPLFVEVLVRDLLQRGVLVARGNGRVVDGVLGAGPPAVLQDLLADRLVGLPPTARDLLGVVAVGADPVPYPLLPAVTRLSDDELSRAADTLLAAGLLTERLAEGGELTYLCSHPVVAEVADGSLSELARRRIHLSYLDALTVTGGTDLDRTARHCEAAGPLVPNDRAIPILVEAGHRNLERGANRSAARFLGAALQRCRLGHCQEIKIDILEYLGVAWLHMLERDAAEAVLTEAMTLAEAADDALRVMRLAGLVSDGAFFRGDLDAERQWLEHMARTVRAAHVASEPLVDAYFGLLSRLPRSGQFEEALAVIDDLVVVVDQLPPTARLRAQRHAALAVGAALSLDVNAMGTHAAQALAHAPEEADVALRARLILLDVKLILGDWSGVASLLDALRVAYEVAGTSRHHWRDGFARLNLFLATGEWDRAAEVVEELGTSGPAVRLRNVASEATVAARYLGLTGDLEGAERRLAAVRELPSATGDSAIQLTLDVGEARLALESGATPPMDLGLRLLHGTGGPGMMFSPAEVGAEVVALAGTVADADGAGAVLRRMGPPGTLPHAVAQRIEGLARRKPDPPEAGRRLLAAAIAFRDLGMPFEAARAELEAAPYRAADDRKATIRSLQEAVALFDRLGATRYGQLGRRALRDLGTRAATNRRPAPDELTSREMEVAALVGRGLSNGEVAERLSISLRTVTSHLDHIYTRLRIGSRSELTQYLRRESTQAPT